MDINKIEAFVNQPKSRKNKTIKFLFSTPGYLFVFFPLLAFLTIGIITMEGNKPEQFSSLNNPENHLCYKQDFVDCSVRVVDYVCQAASHFLDIDACWVSKWKTFNLIVRHWTPPVMEPIQGEEPIDCRKEKCA